MSDDIFEMLKGGTASRLMVERELDRRAAAFTEHFGERTYYAGKGDFIREHGQVYQGRVAWPVPDAYKAFVGAPQWCFRNAFEAAKANPELRYCEGLYMVGSEAANHAWCLTQDDEVIELTLPIDGMAELPPEQRRIANRSSGMAYSRRVDSPETWVYWGVVFPLDQVARFAYADYGYDPDDKTGSVPVLDDGWDDEYDCWTEHVSKIFRRPWRP